LKNSVNFIIFFYLQEEVFDPYGISGRASIAMPGGIYESGRAAGGSMAALLESFQVHP
jgi:hypothetical protein